MNEILIFILKHWVLSLAFFTILIVIITIEAQKANDKNSISPEYLVHLINHEKAVIIDVRPKNIFNTGHIIGAKNFLLSEIENKNSKIKKYIKKNVVVVCGNGNLSMNIAKKLKKMDFENAYYLSGGMQSWSKENLPLAKI